MYLRRGSLDGSQQVEAQHRQDQAFLGRFQERFRSAWEQGPPLQLGSEIIAASDHVRLLGVTVSSDLSLQMYVFSVCSSCFYWLRQIRRIRRSLDTESAKTLVHAFVTSRVDYTATLSWLVH